MHTPKGYTIRTLTVLCATAITLLTAAQPAWAIDTARAQKLLTTGAFKIRLADRLPARSERITAINADIAAGNFAAAFDTLEALDSEHTFETPRIGYEPDLAILALAAGRQGDHDQYLSLAQDIVVAVDMRLVCAEGSNGNYSLETQRGTLHERLPAEDEIISRACSSFVEGKPLWISADYRRKVRILR